jgi:hypothetical protein
MDQLSSFLQGIALALQARRFVLSIELEGYYPELKLRLLGYHSVKLFQIVWHLAIDGTRTPPGRERVSHR